uniref:RRM domain-containing protein n=1 Tax=Eptatretus burgeri TaxID=7764 RepID=A0A8C4QZL5_EPTBU
MSFARETPLECKVYVGNLGNAATKSELERLFRVYGPLRNVWVARNPPGFAFVEFEDPRDARDACREMDGRAICGIRARVEMSTGEKRPKPRWVAPHMRGRNDEHGRGSRRSLSRSPRRRLSRSPIRRRRSTSHSPRRSIPPEARRPRSATHSLSPRQVRIASRSFSRSPLLPITTKDLGMQSPSHSKSPFNGGDRRSRSD